MDPVSSRIKELIDQQAVTNADFAAKASIPAATISHILSGRNKASLSVLERIALEYTNVNLDYLLTGRGELLRSHTSKEEPVKDRTPSLPNTPAPPLNVNEVNFKNKDIEKVLVLYKDKTMDVYKP